VRDVEHVDPRLITRAQATLHLRLPRASLRAEIWRRTLANDRLARSVDVERLGRRFGLLPGSIRNAVATARRFARAEGETGHAALLTEDLERGAALQIRHRLDSLAERVSAALSLDDVILEEPVMAQVQDVLDAARVRETVFEEWGFGARQPRGRGLSILFDGEPGTGKTLCAEVLAAELGLPLFRVSMADVLSKWVGETEKNLKRVFAEARGSHAILLFDEADALFSQRVEVKQAHDRFANMEVNTLLQLMESHDGICVLTTNLKSGIDKAFERRLSFVLHFPFPDEDLREQLWKHHLIKEAPVADDADAYDLARYFELSGGSIRNAVIKAAYRAAAREQSITMNDLIEGAKAECVAAGKLYRIPDQD
jgi:AAA+ superfamily predicted ATPase